MRLVLQRVARASVTVAGERVGAIGRGLLVLAGVERGDGEDQATTAADKIARLRVFEDAAGRMNLDLAQAGGAVLLVPQFTLLASTERGRRPSFDRAAPPGIARGLLERLALELVRAGLRVESGRFGAQMEVELVNDGPVTLVLDIPPADPRAAAFHGLPPLVEATAGQVAGAIAAARHQEEVRRSVDSLGALSEVSRTALEGEDLDLVLERIASFVQRRFDFFLVAIVVADEGMREWSHRAFALREPLELRSPSRWPISRGVVGRALRTGEAQLVLDVGADPDYFPVHERVVAEFASPIRWRGRILGAVNVESDSRDAFPRETRELIEMVATQVAGAIRFALVNWKLEETKRELESANAELERLSLVDALTGVANRRRLDATLELEWRRLARTGRPMSLALLDIDCFKAYNDALGHLEGDRCLRRIGELLRTAVHRAGDLAARYGGEEFAILLTETEAGEANAFADRLRAELAALALPHPASAVAPHVTASLGVATRVPDRGGTVLELVAAADVALYAAKGAGRNRVVAAAPD